RNSGWICVFHPRRSLSQLRHGRIDLGLGSGMGAGHHRVKSRAHRASVQRGRVMAHRTTSLVCARRAKPGLAAYKGLGPLAWLRVLFVCLIAWPITFSAGPVMAQQSLARPGAPATFQGKQTDLGKILKPPRVDKTEPMLLQADEMIYDN